MPLNAKNADDSRVRDIRNRLIASRNAYQSDCSTRDSLVVTMYDEGASIEYLAHQFALTEQKIKYLIDKANN